MSFATQIRNTAASVIPTPKAQSSPAPAGVSAGTAGKIPFNVLQGWDKAAILRPPAVLVNGKAGILGTSALGVAEEAAKQTAREDADQLKLADSLVNKAMGLVGGRSASFMDRALATADMTAASGIRHAVASRLPSQFPDHGFDVGGDVMAQAIYQADADEQTAFQLVQSPNLADESNGLTYYKAASERFGLMETDLTAELPDFSWIQG